MKDCSKTTKEQSKKFLEEYKKKKAEKSSVSALSARNKTTEGSSSKSTAGRLNDHTAVVEAEINGYKFSCRIDSWSPKEAVSDTIVKFLGDKGHFLPKRPLSNPIELKSFAGRPVKSLDMVQSFQSMFLQ